MSLYIYVHSAVEVEDKYMELQESVIHVRSQNYRFLRLIVLTLAYSLLGIQYVYTYTITE